MSGKPGPYSRPQSWLPNHNLFDSESRKKSNVNKWYCLDYRLPRYRRLHIKSWSYLNLISIIMALSDLFATVIWEVTAAWFCEWRGSTFSELVIIIAIDSPRPQGTLLLFCDSCYVVSRPSWLAQLKMVGLLLLHLGLYKVLNYTVRGSAGIQSIFRLWSFTFSN